MPSITCEKCLHQQSQHTTDEAVLSSMLTLNAYFLAVLNDLEIQFGTISSQEVGIIVCVLGAVMLLGFLGMAFWLICIILPWVLGCWVIWRCAKNILADFVNQLVDTPVDERERKKNID